MRYYPLLTGVEFGNPRLTRDWRIWRGYLSWWATVNISQLPGREPRWIARMLGWFLPFGARTIHGARETVRLDPASPMRLGSALWHAFWFNRVYRAPKRIASWAFGRWRGINGSRSDWTDRESGLLYGGPGGSSEAMFEQFLGRIEPTEEQKAAVRVAVDGLTCHLHEHGQEIN